MPGLGASIPLLGVTGGVNVPVVPQEASISDAIGVTYRLAVVRARPASVSEAIHVAPTLKAFFGAVVREQMRIALTQTPNFTYQVTASDVTRLASRLYPGLPVVISEHVGVALAQQAQLVVTIIERLGLTQALAPAMIYNRSLAETVAMASALAKFIGADAADGVEFEDHTGEVTGKGAQLSEGIGIAPTLLPTMLWKAEASDAINLDELNIPAMLYNGELADGIQLSAAYLAPDGSVTTWALNTKSAAVTEYTNYAFNSFAKLGNKYLGASDGGLYELTGDDDDGDEIVAQLRSGFAQWAGTKLASFKGVYLGVRGGGDYVLKLDTGDGKSYVYTLTANDMATTKVRLGKGLRARYFAFELISTGQDFDLDTIEFVPLVSERRV